MGTILGCAPSAVLFSGKPIRKPALVRQLCNYDNLLQCHMQIYNFVPSPHLLALMSHDYDKLCWWCTTKDTRNSPQTLFLVRGRGLGMRLSNGRSCVHMYVVPHMQTICTGLRIGNVQHSEIVYFLVSIPLPMTCLLLFFGSKVWPPLKWFMTISRVESNTPSNYPLCAVKMSTISKWTCMTTRHSVCKNNLHHI